MKVDLSSYNNDWYKPGNAFKRLCWHFINLIFFKSGLFPMYGLKVFLLKFFGAQVGKGVFIKPFVNIKYPWFLSIGNNVWIGENVWIDNLAHVTIGDDVCISQGALLLTGSHDFTKTTFDLIIKPIVLQKGVWICAKSTICLGVICYDHSVVTAGSVITQNCEAYSIYKGNPASRINDRKVK